MNIREALQYLSSELEFVSDGHGMRETEDILHHLLHLNRHQLCRNPTRQLDDDVVAKLTSIIQRRKREEPLPYILGSGYFHSVELVLSSAVLIPRPDTETLVETVFAHEPESSRTFIDIGTGSGAITAAILKNRPAWQGFATDLSYPALGIARKNLSQSTPLCQGDRLECIKNEAQFDFIVSNPPYIASAEFPHLDISVREYEPYLALHGGSDGLDFYRYFAQRGAGFLAENGRLYCEIGYTQQSQVESIFIEHGWRNICCVRDLSRQARVIHASKPSLPL